MSPSNEGGLERTYTEGLRRQRRGLSRFERAARAAGKAFDAARRRAQGAAMGDPAGIYSRLSRYATSCSSSSGVSVEVTPCSSSGLATVSTSSRLAAEPSCR
jgi:hypothetical protein